MSKSEMYIYKLCIQRELKELMSLKRKLSKNEYANIRTYCAVIKQLEKEVMYV